MYLEKRNSTVSSNGVRYYLDGIFRDTEHQPIKHFKVDDLKWVLEFVDHTSPEDQKRVDEADLSAPILVTLENGELVVIDGAHRLSKAVRDNRLTLPGRLVSAEIMKKHISRAKIAYESASPPAWLEWR